MPQDRVQKLAPSDHEDLEPREISGDKSRRLIDDIALLVVKEHRRRCRERLDCNRNHEDTLR
jgi:hypothetical protein